MATAKALTPEQIERGMPGSQLAPWFKPYALAEALVTRQAKQEGDAQTSTLEQLQAKVRHLERLVVAMSKTLGPSGKKLLDTMSDAVGDALAELGKGLGQRFKEQDSSLKAWAQEKLANLDQRIKDLPQPRDGLPGCAGPAGRDGKDGERGADGLGFDDMKLLRTGPREVTLEFSRGERVKRFPVYVPGVVHCGVHRANQTYELGDLVTWAGGLWHCNASSTAAKPGAGCADWTLATKAGRDGKDGRDGAKGDRGPEGKPGRDARPLTGR